MPKLPKVCVYCGATEGLNRDHVPPRCLFATPPSNPVIVPSCQQCNGGASKDDEYFRWALTSKLDVDDHPEIDALTDKVLRSLEKPEAERFLDSLAGSLIPVNALALTPFGSRVELVQGYAANLWRLNRVARRVVLGLFAHEHGRRLPDTHDAFARTESQLSDVDEGTREQLRQSCEAIQAKPPRTIGKEVFSYWFGPLDENDSYTSIWVLLFYQRVGFIGFTRPRQKPA